jgi:hypothetical protein
LTGEQITTSLPMQMRNSTLTIYALGKKINALQTDCTGMEGRMEWTYTQDADEQSCPSDFDYASLLDWKSWWKMVTIEGKEAVGQEETYIVQKVAKDGQHEIDYISTKSFLLLKRETKAQSGAVTRSETYSQYREIEGIEVPMHITGTWESVGDYSARVSKAKYV